MSAEPLSTDLGAHGLAHGAPSAAERLGPLPAGALAPELLTRLDRTFLQLRRAMVKPASASLPVPSLGRQVELTKVMACEAIARVADERAPTVKDVAEMLQLEHSTMSRLLGEAEAEGLLRRGTDSSDRRRTTVTLTDAGRALVADGAYIRTWFMGQLLTGWDDSDVTQLADLLDRMAGDFAARVGAVQAEASRRLGADLGLELDLDC